MPQLQHLLQSRYRLQQSLGQNAGRQTWLAEDSMTQATVVVKLLAFSPQMQWDDLKLFEREAQVLQQLEHPKIPRYLDYFSVDKQAGGGLVWFGLVQDYIPGTSLQELLQQGKHFTADQVRDIAAQVLEILAYLHNLKPAVLHRDIKPSNLIMDSSGQVYLVDFGAVQNQAIEGVTFTVVGTTGYSPLEQFWGRTVPASDLYALGATLIHLLTGVAPADLPQHNLRIQFADRTCLDPSFVNWIEALTAPDLEQRYQTAQHAIEDLLTNRALSYSLKVVRPPVGNRIKLWRSPQQLKIEVHGIRDLLFLPIDLPVFGLKFMLAVSSTLAMTVLLISMVCLLGYGIVLLTSSPSIGIVTTALGFVGLACFLILLFHCLKSIGKELEGVQADLRRSLPPFLAAGGNVFYADKTRFSLEWRLFGWPLRRWRGNLRSLRSIQTGSRGTVSIQTWVKHYTLGYRLSATERRWLAQEIRDWLEQG